MFFKKSQEFYAIFLKILVRYYRKPAQQSDTHRLQTHANAWYADNQ